MLTWIVKLSENDKWQVGFFSFVNLNKF